MNNKFYEGMLKNILKDTDNLFPGLYNLTNPKPKIKVNIYGQLYSTNNIYATPEKWTYLKRIKFKEYKLSLLGTTTLFI